MQHSRYAATGLQLATIMFEGKYHVVCLLFKLNPLACMCRSGTLFLTLLAKVQFSITATPRLCIAAFR